jgi:hypothetical protein
LAVSEQRGNKRYQKIEKKVRLHGGMSYPHQLLPRWTTESVVVPLPLPLPSKLLLPLLLLISLPFPPE